MPSMGSQVKVVDVLPFTYHDSSTKKLFSKVYSAQSMNVLSDERLGFK